MVTAVQQLKTEGHLPKLRYQFRDAAHSTNCVGKNSEKHANPENEIKDFLLTGEASFVKRIRYQTSAKEDWKKVDGGASDVFENLLDLASAPHRWSTKSKAMSALCLKIIKVIKIIVLWSEDSDPNHKDRKIWAKNGLLILRSTGGFAKLLRFGLDTDYTYMCHKLVMVQDKSTRDISLHDWECERYLHITKSLMEEGRIFEPDCQGTFTWAILSAVRNEPLWFLPKSDPASWPKIPQQAFYHAKNLYDVTCAYMKNTFPDYCFRKAMRAFDCSGSALPEAMRLALFQDLAAKENCDAHDVRIQFGSILPLTKSIYDEEGDNERTWCTVIDA